MLNVVKQLSSLYEQELYPSVINLCELIVTVAEQKQEVMPLTKFQIYILYADSFFNTQQYTEAENAYMQALQIRKYILKSKNSGKIQDTHKELVSEIEIKYKVHICCVKQKQFQKAIDILQSIPTRSRSLKINMALGNLHKDVGAERNAITCYKEVLKENPLVLDAAENLLKLGMKGSEVNSLTLNINSDLMWLNTWLRALADMYGQDLPMAIQNFKSLNSQGLLKNNSALLINTAICYTLQCNYTKALSCMQRAFRVFPHMKKFRDLYAFLLAQNSNEKESVKELERLAYSELSVNSWGFEQWVVNGYLMYINKNYDRATYFASQAMALNKKNPEALLLKASSFFQLNQFNDAIRHADEVRKLAPFRYEGHKILVDCYMTMGNHLNDAIRCAVRARKELNNSPQALTLYASVLIKDPLMTSKVKGYLEKALVADPSYSPAVFLLAEHLEQEQRYEEEYTLLKKYSEIITSARIHQLLGDVSMHLQREDEAFEHYSTALRIDPNNQRAQEGISNMGRHAQFPGKINGAYYVTVVDGSSSYVVEARDITPERDHDSLDAWPSNQDFMNYE